MILTVRRLLKPLQVDSPNAGTVLSLEPFALAPPRGDKMIPPNNVDGGIPSNPLRGDNLSCPNIRDIQGGVHFTYNCLWGHALCYEAPLRGSLHHSYRFHMRGEH